MAKTHYYSKTQEWLLKNVPLHEMRREGWDYAFILRETQEGIVSYGMGSGHTNKDKSDYITISQLEDEGVGLKIQGCPIQIGDELLTPGYPEMSGIVTQGSKVNGLRVSDVISAETVLHPLKQSLSSCTPLRSECSKQHLINHSIDTMNLKMTMNCINKSLDLLRSLKSSQLKDGEDLNVWYAIKYRLHQLHNLSTSHRFTLSSKYNYLNCKYILTRVEQLLNQKLLNQAVQLLEYIVYDSINSNYHYDNYGYPFCQHTHTGRRIAPQKYHEVGFKWELKPQFKFDVHPQSNSRIALPHNYDSGYKWSEHTVERETLRLIAGGEFIEFKQSGINIVMNFSEFVTNVINKQK